MSDDALLSTTARAAEWHLSARVGRALAAAGTMSTLSTSTSCRATLDGEVAVLGEDVASEKPLVVLEGPQKLGCAAAGEKL